MKQPMSVDWWEKRAELGGVEAVMNLSLTDADAVTADQVETILSLLPIGSWRQSTVIDWGCGVGRLTCRLAESVKEITGVDWSENMLAEAKAVCGKGVSFLRANVADVDNPGTHITPAKAYTVAVQCSVGIHLLTDAQIRLFVANMARSARKRLVYVDKVNDNVVAPYVHVWPADFIRGLLEEHGFSMLKRVDRQYEPEDVFAFMLFERD